MFLIPFLLLLLLAFGAWFLARLQAIRIRHIDVIGAAALSGEAIVSETKGALSGMLWRVIPRDNFFLVSSSAIETRLRDAFPGAFSILVAKKFPDRVVVSLQERTLWGVYCKEQSGGGVPASCFYLDDHGVAYEPLSHVEGSLLPMIYASADHAVGDAVVGSEFILFYGDAARAVHTINGELVSATLATTTATDVRLHLAEGWDMLVNSAEPVSAWTPVLRTVLEKEIGPRRTNLDYVDLRFGNKVFYKLQN